MTVRGKMPTTVLPTSLPPLRPLFSDDVKVGMTERLKKTIAASDVVGFAQLTGDRNPIHLSEHFAARDAVRPSASRTASTLRA